jgi:hypothetical protein
MSIEFHGGMILTGGFKAVGENTVPVPLLAVEYDTHHSEIKWQQ